jgi:transposase InsO family protein
MVTPAARRQAVAHLCSTYEVSQRRACAVIGADRMSMRYRSLRPDDAALRTRLRELAAERRRFGYRRLHILMRREGFIMNHKKLRRIYREERLMVRRRGGRKRALGTRAPLVFPRRRTNAGRSISCPISSAITVASASWPSSTTSHENAWRSWRTHPCQAHGWHASWI